MTEISQATKVKLGLFFIVSSIFTIAGTSASVAWVLSRYDSRLQAVEHEQANNPKLNEARGLKFDELHDTVTSISGRVTTLEKQMEIVWPNILGKRTSSSLPVYFPIISVNNAEPADADIVARTAAIMLEALRERIAKVQAEKDYLISLQSAGKATETDIIQRQKLEIEYENLKTLEIRYERRLAMSMQ